MKCNHCGFEQETGNFCGKCGRPLDMDADVKTHQTEEMQSESNGNDAVARVKDTSKQFGAYFKTYLAEPAAIFKSRGSEFANGVINLVIIALLLVLSTYLMVSRMWGINYLSYMYDGPSFFTFFISALIFTLVSMMVVILALFIVDHILGMGYTFKEIISIYGAHMVPVGILAVISLVLILVKSYSFGTVIIFATFGIALSLVPFYLISRLLSKRAAKLDPLYGVTIYTVLVSIMFVIIFSIMSDSAMGQIFSNFNF